MTDLNKELERAVELTKLLNREVGNEEHLFLQANLLVEEGISELAKAIFENDRTQLRDAIADTLVIAMGGFYIAGGNWTPRVIGGGGGMDSIMYQISDVMESAATRCESIADDFEVLIDYVNGFARCENVNLASDLEAVNDSNLSKFCLTIAEGIDTQQQYLTQFNLESELKETGNPDYPYAVYSLENKGDFRIGKLLKSINYKAPVFKAES